MFKRLRPSIPGRGAAERLGVLFFAVSLMVGVLGFASAGRAQTAPAFTSAAGTTFTTNTPGSFTVTTSGVPTPTFSESGALPSGVIFVDNGDGTATLSGTPAGGTGGAYPVTITASNGVAPDANQSFTLTVDAAPTIGSADHTAFLEGAPGTFTVTTSGVPTPTLSESGTIPAGTTFVDNGDGTATLSGTPSAGTAGSYPITITASNGVAPDATQAFTLTVAPPIPTLSEWATIAFAALTAGVGALAVRRRRKA
jgi:hypothetical protein